MNAMKLIGVLLLAVLFIFSIIAAVFYLIIIQHKGNKDNPKSKGLRRTSCKDKKWM